MSTAMTAGLPAGGEFLLRAVQPDEVFTPEDFTEEHRAIARTTEEFWAKEAGRGSKQFSTRNRAWPALCCGSRRSWD